MPANPAPAARSLLPAGVYGVVRSPSTREAVNIATAWMTAGVPAVEVTMTVPDAVAVMEEVSAACASSSSLLGAGTVLRADDVDRCAAAGARFVVSPVTRMDVIERAVELGIPVVAGVLTPSEAWDAHVCGATALKIFPVDAVGGARYATTLLEPLPGLCLIASGGVRVSAVRTYLDAGFHGVALGRTDLLDAHANGTPDLGAMIEFTRRVLEDIAGQWRPATGPPS